MELPDRLLDHSLQSRPLKINLRRPQCPRADLSAALISRIDQPMAIAPLPQADPNAGQSPTLMLPPLYGAGPAPRARGTIFGIVTASAFAAGYAGLILYFAVVDVYHQHFFDRSYAPLYNTLRIAFGVYLFFLLYTTGSMLLKLLQRQGRDASIEGVATRIVVCFFAGAIVWQFLMLALGFLSLYYRMIAVAATIPVMVQASLDFRPLTCRILDSMAVKLHSYDVYSRAVAAMLVAFLLAAASGLVIIKGLYPAGSHDYFTHYFYYYTTSLKNHGIWPNDVWYHYFYSKGQGIFFLGMLLTDPLAPSVVTAVFIAVGALALFLFIDRMMPGTLWPWAAAACWLLVLICAGGEEGFAEFPKEHELNAAFVITFVWLCDGVLRSTRSELSLQFWLAAGCAFAVAFVEQPTPIVLGLVTGGVASVLLLLRRLRQSLQFMLLTCACGLGLVCNLMLNYLTTGIANDVLVNALWPVANLRKVEALGWMFPVVKRSHVLSGLMGRHWGDMDYLLEKSYAFLHLDFIQPWFGYAPGAAGAFGTAVILAVFRKRIPPSVQSSALIIFATFLVFLVFASTLGGTTAESFSRYASFMLTVELASGAMLWMVVADLSGVSWIRRLAGAVLPAAAAVLVLLHIWHSDRAAYRVAARDAIKFASGQYSIYEAYKAYDPASGWPFREPWGAIYPASLAIWKQLGHGTRVWTFNVHAYCMLPDCRWEANGFFPMSPHMFDILFGPSDRARDILQREGLNYFLISRELEITDIRPAVGLFSPDCIGSYLGVKWTDGTTYLLTWLGPGVEPLSAAWLEAYRRQIADSPQVQQFPQELFRTVYDRLKAGPAWGKDLKLPWLE